jgi:hypothetical protein
VWVGRRDACGSYTFSRLGTSPMSGRATRTTPASAQLLGAESCQVANNTSARSDVGADASGCTELADGTAGSHRTGQNPGPQDIGAPERITT